MISLELGIDTVVNNGTGVQGAREVWGYFSCIVSLHFKIITGRNAFKNVFIILCVGGLLCKV